MSILEYNYRRPPPIIHMMQKPKCKFASLLISFLIHRSFDELEAELLQGQKLQVKKKFINCINLCLVVLWFL